MALSEQDREDLLRDGRAMPVRAEILVDSAVWLVGFRPQGQVSFYVGADLVFQFNVAGELRRVFVAGERIAAEGGRLQRLRMLDRGQRLHLIKELLTEEEQRSILFQLGSCLQHLEKLAKESQANWKTVGISEAKFCERLLSWLGTCRLVLKIADAPNAR
jgi:hypothetical protein